MAHAENKVVINKTVSEVYNFLLDGLNNPKWRPSVVDISLKSPSPGLVGTEYRQLLRGPAGKYIDADYRWVSIEPNRQLSFEVISGPVRPHGSYYFMEIGAGTELTFTLDYRPSGLKRLLEPMVNKSMKEEVRLLTDLKHYLENKKSGFY